MSGSPYYIAPEVFLQKYNSKIDIWSMGVVLYIMLSGKVPFPGRTEHEIIQNVIKGTFHFNHPAFENVSEDCKDLIRCCLVKEYEKRFSAQQALNHRWIQQRGSDLGKTGTIGDGVSSQVIDGIAEVLGSNEKMKSSCLKYF